MKILERYIVKEALINFAISLFALTGILLTARILKFADLIVNKGVVFSQVALVFVAIVPTFLEIAIPMATLLGIMLTFARMSGDSEIIVIRASGISLYQLIRPVILFGVITSCLSFGVSYWARPWGFYTLSDTLLDIARSKTTSGLDAGVFNRLGKLILYAEDISFADGAMKHVLIDDQRDPMERKIIIAKRGSIISNEATESIVLNLFDGTIHERQTTGYSLTAFDSNFVNIASNELFDSGSDNQERKVREETSADLHNLLKQTETYLQEYPLQPEELHKPASGKHSTQTEQGDQDALEQVGRDKSNMPLILKRTPTYDWLRTVNELKIEIARRFSMPCAALLLGLLAMPLGIQPPRMQKTWGASLSLSLGLLAFTVYFALISLMTAVAEAGAFPVWLATWLPNMIIASLAIAAIHKMSTEQWQSVAHAAELLFNYVSKWFRRKKVAPEHSQ